MGKIRQRGKIWYVDYRVKGQRVRKRIGSSKKLAELALKDIEVKLAKNELGFLPKDSDLDRLFQEFPKYCKSHHAPSTIKRYKAILDNFKRYLLRYPHITKISHLNVKFFDDYIGFRKGEGALPKTINIEIQTIKLMFNLAIKWGYCRDNPLDQIKLLKVPKKIHPRFLNADECEKLLNACDEWLYSIFYTFLQTGMRKSELENLTWNDVDFKRRKIKVLFKDDWSPKTSEREIPINDALLNLLQKHKSETWTRKCQYVFQRNGHKIEPNYLRKRLIPLTRKCGFPDVTKIHTLRHTFASHLVMNGVDLPTVKKLLGHSDIATTMIYSHLSQEHVEKAVEKLKL